MYIPIKYTYFENKNHRGKKQRKNKTPIVGFLSKCLAHHGSSSV